MVIIYHSLIHQIIILADIQRNGNEFEGAFIVVNKGRMANVIYMIEDTELKYCAYMCVKHLNCVSINHNYDLKLCELVSEEFDHHEAYEFSQGWRNYGTPRRSTLIFFSFMCNVDTDIWIMNITFFMMYVCIYIYIEHVQVVYIYMYIIISEWNQFHL